MNNKNSLKRLVQICTMKKGIVISAMILIIIAAVAAFIPYISIYYIISELLRPLINKTSELNTTLIFQFIGLVIGGIIVNFISYFSALCLLHKAAFETIYLLKTDVIKHFTELPIGFGIRMGSGNIRKILDEDIGNTEEFLAHQFPNCVYTVVSIIAMLSILIMVDWRLGLICLIIISISLYILGCAFKIDTANSNVREFFKANTDLNNIAVEYVRGISVLKIFNTTLTTIEKFYSAIKGYTKAATNYTLELEKIMATYTVLVQNIYLFMLPVILIIGQEKDNYIEFISKAVFCLLISPIITNTMLRIVRVISLTMQMQYGISSIDNILLEPAIKIKSSIQLKIKNYDVKFEDVTFSYDSNEINALENINFTAKSKCITAVVGSSGSGKSTIAQLIPRFYDIKYGKILIGGINTKDMDMNSLMNIVSFVFQDTYIFKKSIRDNICMGRQNATEEEIISAAKNAQCHQFISNLPNGYDTLIGSSNIHLSGGEKQRLAIARAILQDTPIIVLDEATAFNDPENEFLIQKAFEKLLLNKTVIMIAHRLNTIKNADNIIVMDKGKIVETGTHEQLLRDKGKYNTMWEIYNQTKTWNIGGDRIE